MAARLSVKQINAFGSNWILLLNFVKLMETVVRDSQVNWLGLILIDLLVTLKKTMASAGMLVHN